MDVCDHDFHLVAQRKCVTLSDGHQYCPSAYGMRKPKTADLVPYIHDHPEMLREDQLPLN